MRHDYLPDYYGDLETRSPTVQISNHSFQSRSQQDCASAEIKDMAFQLTTHSQLSSSPWYNDTIKAIHAVNGQATSPIDDDPYSDSTTLVDSVSSSEATSETRRASEDMTARMAEKHQLLQACSNGDLCAVRAVFANLRVDTSTSSATQPSPTSAFYARRQSTATTTSHPRPPTNLPISDIRFLLPTMLRLAVQHQHPEVMSYLFGTFPTLGVDERAVSAALEHRSTTIFSLLLTHDPSILNKPVGGHRGPPFCEALKTTTDSTLPSFLLDRGADPNLGGFGPVASSSNLAVAVRNQPLELIKKMLDFGADVWDDDALNAARLAKRRDVVKCLERARRRR